MADNEKKSGGGGGKRSEAAPRSPSAGLAKEGQHSMGGVTTRDDALDLGVPMEPGDPNEEHTGPEDALAPGPKRGNYDGRMQPGIHVVTELDPDYETPTPDDDGRVEERPAVRAVLQAEVDGSGKAVRGQATEG